MYPRNAASPQRVAIGPVVQISDGAVQTSGVSVKVMPQGAAASAGGGTVGYEEGIVHYVPTQGETNYTSFQLIAYKTGCIPACVTVVTSASAVAGYAGLDWAAINAPTTSVNFSATTISTSQAVASVSGAVGSVTGNVSGSVASVASGGITSSSFASGAINAAAIASDAITAAKLAADAGAEIASAVWGVDLGAAATSYPQAAATLYALRDQVLNVDSDLALIPALIPSAASIADAVWDEATSGHLTGGTAGKALYDADLRGSRVVARGTVTTGGSTTSIPTSAFSPAGAAADQFKGRIVIFDADTATAALRGQATDITASSNSATPTLTVTALTTAPSSGDSFTVV